VQRLAPESRSLEQVERDHGRLKELRADEARLEREAAVTWLSNPEKVAEARMLLAVVREIIDLAPTDLEQRPLHSTPEETEARERDSRVAGLRSVVRERRGELTSLRHSVEAVETKLAGPVDLRDYKPPRFNPAQNPVAAEEALNSAYDQHCERYRAVLRKDRARFLARIEVCEAEAARAEGELREMGVEI
jgi:hypothetical protein